MGSTDYGIPAVGCQLGSATVPAYIGANQAGDMLVGCAMSGAVTDLGTGTKILGDSAGVMDLRAATAFSKVLSMRVGTAEKAAFLPHNNGVDYDLRGATNGTLAVILGGADGNASFGVQDNSGNPLFRVFGNGDVSVRRAGNTADILNISFGVLTFGTGSAAGDTNRYRAAANILGTDDALEMVEQGSDPSAPPSNKARLFVKDDGSGKTGLYVRFPTGAVQQIALEP